jgi:hypothetical protein
LLASGLRHFLPTPPLFSECPLFCVFDGESATLTLNYNPKHTNFVGAKFAHTCAKPCRPRIAPARRRSSIVTSQPGNSKTADRIAPRQPCPQAAPQ